MKWELPKSDTYFAKILEQTPEGFELDHLEHALEHCHKFRVAVDGGAHIGTWTLALAKRFQQVFSFEPAFDTYKCLRRNTEEYVSRISYLNAALGAVCGTCRLADDPTRVGNTGARFVRAMSVGEDKMVALDAVVTVTDNIDFIKLDLEGFEAEALRGAVKTIERCRPTIVVECKQFNPLRNGGPEATRQLLTNLGYAEVGGIRNDRVFTPA